MSERSGGASEQVRDARERANRQAGCPELFSELLVILDHSAVVGCHIHN